MQVFRVKAKVWQDKDEYNAAYAYKTTSTIPEDHDEYQVPIDSTMYNESGHGHRPDRVRTNQHSSDSGNKQRHMET